MSCLSVLQSPIHGEEGEGFLSKKKSGHFGMTNVSRPFLVIINTAEASDCLVILRLEKTVSGFFQTSVYGAFRPKLAYSTKMN